MAFLRTAKQSLSLASIFCLISRCLVSAEVTESGLEIQYLNEVKCTRTTKAGDNVIMHYNGTLEDGTEFDSSYKRNRPFQFRLGAGQVIEGWDKGLLDMCIQEERRLIIPPNLAYGDSNVGTIPGGSTLIFGTKLMGIVGVEDDSRILSTSEEISDAEPADAFDKPQWSTETSPAAQASATSSANGSKASDAQTGSEDTPGECSLLGPFSLVIQGGLGLLAMVSVVWKRWRERPRRPLKIWFFDVSKQVFGSALLHIFNLLLSLLSSGAFEINRSAQQAGAALKDEYGEAPNPCSYYLLNIAIDTTLGIPILVMILKVLHVGLRRSGLVQPPESIKSGFYGHPPRATWWLKQSMIYFVGLVLMKSCVFFIFKLLPWLSWVGDWALRWTEGNEALQISFVMFIFPVVMNAIQYYIIDSFIKDQSGSEYAPDSADDAAEQYQPVRRDSLDSEDSDLAGQSSEDAETRKVPQTGTKAKADAGEGASDEDSLERRSRSAERPVGPEAAK